MHGPLISVVMPTYNSRKTVGIAIFSVINQRYKDFELIIVDDGSSDGVEAEVRLFSDKRIRFCPLETNCGISAALNVGIKEAKGRFVARMDSDDYMEDFRLVDQIKYMMSENLAIVGSAADKFGVDTGLMHPPESGQDIINSILVCNPFIHPTVMFDLEQLGSALFYNENFACEEDYELWSRIITPENCRNIGYSMLKYRVGSVSNANNPHKKRLNHLVLSQIASRFGISGVAPIDELNEFQIGGFIDAYAYAKLAEYARYAKLANAPRLGWIQEPLLKYRSYEEFFKWLNRTGRYV